MGDPKLERKNWLSRFSAWLSDDSNEPLNIFVAMTLVAGGLFVLIAVFGPMVVWAWHHWVVEWWRWWGAAK